MHSSRLALLSSLAWLATGACSPDMPGRHYVVIKTDSLPGGSYLRFKPRLDGRRAEQMDLRTDPNVTEVQFELLSMDAGRFSVDVAAVGMDGWPTAEGHVTVDVSADTQTQPVQLKLVPIDQAVCVPAVSKMDRWCQTEAASYGLNLQAIHGTDSDNIWAVGSRSGNVGSIWHWNGFRWRQEKTPGGPATLAAVWASSYDEAWAVGESNNGAVVWHWNANEQRWDDADGPQRLFSASPPLKAIWGSSTNDIWAAGGAKGPASDDLPVWHWDGHHWNKATVEHASSIRDIWGADAKHVWMVGENDTVLQLNGEQWQRPLDVPSNMGRSWSSVWVSPKNDVSLSDGDRQLITLNEGKWTTDSNMKGDKPTRLRGSCGATGECDLWGIKGPQLVHLEAGGWKNVDEDRAEDGLSGLWALGSSSVWVAGEQGRIWELAPVDNVKRRIDRHSPPGYYIYDLWFDDQNRLWLFGERAWRWDGWKWVQVGKRPQAALRSIAFNNEKDIWAGGEFMGDKLLHWTGNDSLPDTWTDYSIQAMKYKGSGVKRFSSINAKVLYPVMYTEMGNCPGFAVLSADDWKSMKYSSAVNGISANFAASCAMTASDYDSCVVVGTRDSMNRILVYEAKAMMETWNNVDLSGAGLTNDSNIMDMQSLMGTGLIWVAFSNSNASPTSKLVRLNKQGNNWMATKAIDLPQMVPSRLLVKGEGEIWTVGSSGAVLRSNGIDLKAEGADLSFDLKAAPKPPSLRAIAVGKGPRQVWVADEANGVLWRLAQP